MGTTGYDAACRFYDIHYEVIGEWFLEPGKKIILGQKDNQVCRFCGHIYPLVTFKSEVHAIPECIGNKSLYTTYECDTCNHMFGSGIENDFGNWSKPMRNFTRTRGKRGVPTIKMASSGGSQGRFGTTDTAIQQNPADPAPIFEVDEKTKTVVFSIPRDPYTPVAVLKTFLKIGLSVLPEEEIPDFRGILSWIRDPNHHACPVIGYPVLRTFVPGPYVQPLTLRLLRRRTDRIMAPYITFVLGYGNEVFQVWLLSDERDRHIMGRKITFPPFPVVCPVNFDENEGALFVRLLLPEMVDLTGCSRVANDIEPITIQFDTMSQEPLKPTPGVPQSQYQTLNLRVTP